MIFPIASLQPLLEFSPMIPYISFAASTMTDLENAVNLELRNLQRWLITNRLSLNIAKTEFMVIGSNQRIHALSNNQIDIEIDGKAK